MRRRALGAGMGTRCSARPPLSTAAPRLPCVARPAPPPALCRLALKLRRARPHQGIMRDNLGRHRISIFQQWDRIRFFYSTQKLRICSPIVILRRLLCNSY